MALTIYQTPQEYSPAFNDLNFVADSSITDVLYTNLVRILSPVSKDFNLKYLPRPVDHLMYSDVHPIVEGFLSHDFEFTVPADTTFTRCPNSWVKYKCDIAENGSTTSGTNKFAFNALLNYDEFINYDQSEYLLSSGETGKKFLTNSPRSIEVRIDQRYYLGIMTRLYPSYVTVNQIEINTYDVNGNLIHLTGRINPYTSTTEGNGFLNLLVGPKDLNDANLPGLPIITSDVAYYTVQIYGTSDYTSELFTFRLNHKCTEYQVFQLFFLNRLGRFDAFSFTQANQKFNNYEKSNYKQYTGQMVNNQWTRYSHDRAVTQYNTLNTETRLLNSDWITEEESAWLEELVSSPVIYLWDGTNWFSVNIQETNYEQKFYNNSQLFNLQLTIEYSIQNQRQRA